MMVFQLTLTYNHTHAIHVEPYSTFKEAYERLEKYAIQSHGRGAKIVEVGRNGSCFENEVYYEILKPNGEREPIYSAIQISSHRVFGLPDPIMEELYNKTYQAYVDAQRKDLLYHPKGDVL